MEVVALQARAIRWLGELRRMHAYPYDGVKVTTTDGEAFWTFQQWYERILAHFDASFFILSSPHGAYYRDGVGQTVTEAALQLRPNFVGSPRVDHTQVIAMAVAPSLFVSEHAVEALNTARVLFSEPLQLGVKTLAPWDTQYRSSYDNAKRFEGDLTVCGGWSYHNVRSREGFERRGRSGCG